MPMSLAFSALRLATSASLLASRTLTQLRLRSLRRWFSSKAVRRRNCSASYSSLSNFWLWSMSSSSRAPCCSSSVCLWCWSWSRLFWRAVIWLSSFLSVMLCWRMSSSFSLRCSLARASSMPSQSSFCSLSSIFRMWFRCTISLFSPTASLRSLSPAIWNYSAISAIWLFFWSSSAFALSRSNSECSRAEAWFWAIDWKWSSCSLLKVSWREFICWALRKLPRSRSSLRMQTSLMSSSILRSQSLNLRCDSPTNRAFSKSMASSAAISALTCCSSFCSSATMILPRSSSIAYSSAFQLASPWFFSTNCSMLMFPACSYRFFSVSFGY